MQAECVSTLSRREPEARAIDNELARADCQSAIQPINNRRYSVAQTGSLLYRRLLIGRGCATTSANFINGHGSDEIFTRFQLDI